jgi:hypothetical protein
MAFLPGAVPDQSAFTAAASPLTPVGGVWNDALAALTAGQTGELRITERRAAHVNLRNETGAELGIAAAPLQVSLANTAANATAVKVDGSAVTQPVSEATLDAAIAATGAVIPAKTVQVGGSDGTDIRTLATDASGRQKVLLYDAAGNALTSTSSALDVNLKTSSITLAENLTQLAGTAVDVNSGVKSAGTQRVVLATDQPALTTPLPVTEWYVTTGSVSRQRVRANLTTGAVSVNSTTAVTLATGAPGYYIESIKIFLDFGATVAAASVVALVVQDTTSGTVYQARFFVLAAAALPTLDSASVNDSAPPGFFWNNKTANSVLQAVSSSNFTAGSFIVQVTYGICSFVG